MARPAEAAGGTPRVALNDEHWRGKNMRKHLVVAAGMSLLALGACASKGDVESLRSDEDMRALFHQGVKPRLANHPDVGAFNQEV